jgi:Protein of unknown function (DUF551)
MSFNNATPEEIENWGRNRGADAMKPSDLIGRPAPTPVNVKDLWWRECSAVMPSLNVPILFCSNGRVVSGVLRDNQYVYFTTDDEDRWPEVTHWMPRPEPPP